MTSIGKTIKLIKNQEPRTKNQEPRTKNQEPRTKNQEPQSPLFLDHRACNKITAYNGKIGEHEEWG